MKKRVLSLFMALALCLTLLPTAALAEGTEGTAQTPPAVEKAADPANGEEQQENQPAEQEEQQEDSAAKQAVATVQAMIDALPAVDELDGMDDDDAMAVYEAFQTACDAYYETLTEEQQAQLKNTEKLAALSKWFNAQVAPLAWSGDICPDTVDANGNIIRHTGWRRNGPIYEGGDGDADFTDAQFYVVQGNDVTIGGNLTIGGSCGLILCQGATLTVEGALICSGSYSIYGQSNGGAYAGRLVVKNSLDDGAAIRTGSTSTPQLNIYSGEVTINAGNSGKLVEGVELCSTSKIHAATLAAKKVLPAEWRGVSSIKGTSLVLEYCGHAEDDPEYVDYVEVGETQHRWQCKACGFEGGVEACFTNTTISGITPNDNGTHTWKCICGREKNGNCSYESLSTPEATPDGKGHTARMCSVCGSPEGKAEAHTYDADGKCTTCTFEPLAKDEAGDLYGRTQDHSDVSLDVNDALAEGHTITLWRPDTIASKTIQCIYIDFDAAGKSATLDMNGYSLETSKSAPITVENGTLTVTGDATLVQNGTQELASSAVRVTGGTLIFDGKLTATGASGKPAVEVTGGTLRLKAGDVLNGGVSVAGSTAYANVNALLGDGLAFAKEDEHSIIIVNGNVKSIDENVVVKEHGHSFTLGSDGKYTCVCGYTCLHNEFENGVCKICGNGCAHTNVDDDGVCRNCKAQMAVKIETGGTVTYSTDFKSAMHNATNGTKITLLADVSIVNRTGISGDNTTITLDLNGHKITSGWLDVGNGKSPTACTLKIIGKGSYEPPLYGGIITVNMKATLDLSGWEGGTISSINISDNSNYEAATREAAVIVGPKAGTIGNLSFGNNQLDELKKTKLSGGSFNEIWVADFGPVKLGELLADGYAYQNADGSYVKYETTLQGASIYNVKVVKCLHPNMKPDAATGMATCEYCGKSGKFVASVDGNLYTDMNGAISYWLENSGTLKLYGDYTATDGTWRIGSGSHTINLNGHRMSVQNDGAFKPTHNMHLTVTDGTERGQITNILLDGSQRGSFTLENGFVGNLKMTGGAVVALKGGSVDNLDVQDCSENTNLSIQGGSLGKLNIKDWADGMHVSATGGSLGAYTLPSGKILADVLDHQYYATGTSLDKRVDAVAQKWEKFDIKQAPYDFGSTSKAANVPINGSIPFRVDSPSENVGLYEVKWYRRTNSGAEHMVENKVADVNVNDTLDVFCVITGLDRPGGAMQWQVAVKGYTIKVVPAKLNGDQTVITQKPNTGNTGNPADNRLVVTPLSSNALSDVEYKFAVTYNGQPLELNKDYTIKDSSNRAMNAGTHTLTIEGRGNYTGQKSVTWTLEPYELSVENFRHAQINKTYDGTDAVTDSTNGINGLGGFIPDSKNPRNPILSTVDVFNLGKSDYQLSNMKFDSAEAGDRTFTGTMTLTSGGNFVFAGGNRVMQIEYSSGRVSVSINRAIIAAPAAKALQVANNHAATYTVDLSALLPKLESPKKYGEVTYELGTDAISFTTAGYYDATKGNAEVKGDKLILPIQAVETDTTGNIGSVKVKVSTTNYHDFTLTINVIAKNRITPTGTPTLSKNAIIYGDALNTIALSGKLHDNVNNVDVDGTFEWVDGTHIPVVGNGTYAAEWIFEPTDTEKYLTVSGRSNITVEKAQQYGKVSMDDYVYGKTPSTPSLTDRTGDGSVTCYYTTTNSNSGGTKWENIQANTLNAGTYYMYAELGETENYGSFTAACVQFRVVKAMPTCTKPTGLTAIYGQTLADVTLPDGWSWMDSSESVGGASTAAKKFMAKFTPTDTDNYNMVENIELEVMVNKADGGNLKTVELEQKYTDASDHTYTPDWAGLPAGQDWTFSSEASIVLPKQDFAADGNLLTYAISGGKAGDKITIILKASCNNYEDFTITLTITLTEKDNQQALRITGGTTVVYGQTLQLGTSGGTGSGAVTYTVTNGTGEATIDSNGVLTPVRIGSVTVTATKAGGSEYNAVTSSPVEITITRATPTGEPAYTKITASGKTLADAALGIGTITPADGTIAWDDPTTTEVVANKSYGWTYTPTDTNYTTLTGSIQLWHKSTSSGGGSYYAPTVPDMPMLYRGCTGDAVKTLQDKLNTLGYNSGNVDGIFGAKTYAAVTAFQKANNLGVDGIVGKLTWAKLYGVSPAMPVETTVVGRPMVSYGSRGDAVRKLQELLNALGYDCGSVDGIFGSKTKAAVLAFQKANGLAADGIVGPLTWGKLV